MKSPDSPARSAGRVASLHLHPIEPGAPLRTVDEIEVVAGKGILNEPRYFGKISRKTGRQTRRQISLIEREQIAEHAVALGLQSISPGAVRANVETFGIDLVQLVNSEIQIGDTVLFIREPRKPCEKMEEVCAGLRALMQNNRQGVLAEVVRPGKIRVGDSIVAREHLDTVREPGGRDAA